MLAGHVCAEPGIAQWRKENPNTCIYTYTELQTDDCKYQWYCPAILNAWQIALIAVGGVVIIALCITGCYCCCCRRKPLPQQQVVYTDGGVAQPAYYPNGAFKA